MVGHKASHQLERRVLPSPLREIQRFIIAEAAFRSQGAEPPQIADGSATYEILTSSDKWFGVTYKEDKPEVVAKFAELKANGTYPINLWK